MTGLADILNATAKPCPVVLGLRMVPFTVGHAVMLHRMGSPFVLGGQVDANHLIEACIICSQSAEESLKTMASAFRWLPLRLMRRKVAKADLLKECETMQEWVAAQSDCPEVLREPGGRGKKPAMPWPERILVGLINIGFSEKTVMTMPVVDAERFFLTHAEMQGQIELWDDQQDALWRYAQEHSTIRN